ARQRCWRYDWVLDIDVRRYFDSIDWGLLLRAVHHHTDCPWVLLYIERWLKAPEQREDGSVVPRIAGTPQGGVISPLLANLFLHYAFDMWMTRTYPHIPFERYADDIICHCKSADEAQALWSALADRLAACKLNLHPEKTKTIYCKDANRRGDFPNQSFDFLGFTFRARKTVWQGHIHAHGFMPAASPAALQAMSRTIRRWALHHRSDKALQDLAAMYNPCIRGWINYYGNFYHTQLRPTLTRIDAYVIRWARRKFKRLRHQTKGARDWFVRLRRLKLAAILWQRPNIGSRMRVNAKGLHWTVATLADGTKKTYWYAWRGGPRLEGEPGSAQFIASYNAAMATKVAAPEGRLLALLQGYQQSQ